MTEKEGIILSAYTGYLLCDNFGMVHKYVQELYGRPVFTHEIPELYPEIQNKLRPEIERLIKEQTK